MRVRSLPGRRAVATLVLAVAVLAPAALPAQAPRADDAVPAALDEVLFGGNKQPRVDVVLNGIRFRAIRSIGAHPDLAWPVAAAGLALAKDRDAVTAWLQAAGPTLGHGGFAPRFTGTSQWRGREVWEFGFVHDGVALLDYHLRVYWDGERFAGFANHFPAPITAVEPATADDRAASNRAYHAERGAGGFRIVLATLQQQSTRDAVVTTVRTATGVAYRRHEARELVITPLSAANITEYPVPAGTTFPDQIWADAKGLIWFSQPPNRLVTSFDPVTLQFQAHSTSPGLDPDGLTVDDRDRVWTGLYSSQELGYLDTQTNVFTRIPAPYSPSNPAIPTLSSSGTIWVTDHANNKISEWDPVGQSWLQTVTMPTAACWVVQGVLDPTRGSIWFTEYNANQLGVKPVGQPVLDVPVPAGGGPAFLAYNDDKVYYSLWLTNRLGEYDVVSGQFTEYTFQANETGGPMWMAPDGKVVLGTRNAGVIVVFDPVTKGITHYPIPTAAAGLKDGLTVAQDGVIWFTESGKAKIAKLVLP